MKMFNRIYIEITNICNLNCDFCPETKRIKKSISVEEFKTIIEKIKNHTNHIYLHVKGEPLLHNDLETIIKIANKENLNVNITTNGRLLKQKLDIINKTKIRQINVSLHSFDNLKEIKSLLETIEKIKKTYISLRLWNNKDNKEIIEALENKYKVKINQNEKRQILKENIFLDKDIEFDWPDIKKEEISACGKCKGGKTQLAILVDGKVVPCCLDNDGIIELGNIFNETLEEILNKERYKNLIKGFNENKLTEKLCRTCGYKERFK